MPWRGEKDLYKIWLSEIMLQQTQIKTVIPYYKRWLREFPDVKSVAKADEEKILKFWEGLGYYTRARNFHQACKDIQEKYGGKIPESSVEFFSLKGVGPYTLAAVQSIGLNKNIPVLDGNVKRVTARLLGLNKPIKNGLHQIQQFLEDEIISSRKPGDFNQAMMDLGRTVCLPKNPVCNMCPISNFCLAYKTVQTELIPIIEPKKKVPHYKMAVGMVWKNGRFLMGRRKSEGLLGGMWELPGFNLDSGNENFRIEKLLESESGIVVKKGQTIGETRHTYSHFSIEMEAFGCEYISGVPHSSTHAQWKWITNEERQFLPVHRANQKLFDSIFGHSV